MLTVTGTIDSVPYRVGIHDGPVPGELHGCVMGSTHATALLELHAGDLVRETPTHGAVRLSLDDPRSVFAALQEFTHVAVVDGTVPWHGGHVLPEAIY